MTIFYKVLTNVIVTNIENIVAVLVVKEIVVVITGMKKLELISQVVKSSLDN